MSGSNCGCPDSPPGSRNFETGQITPESDPENFLVSVDMAEDVNPNYQKCTVCTGDISNSIWYVNGQCKLDQMTYDVVWGVLQRVPGAKADLLRITSNPTLIFLANESELLTPVLEQDAYAAKRINANTLPYYTVFRGKI